LTNDKLIQVEKLAGTRYARILTYPATDSEQEKLRVAELRSMGVSAMGFKGHTLIDGVPVLGKGCVGIVTQAIVCGELAAVKIRRLDADRPSMQEEARLLRLANAVGVGPRLMGATRNFLVMKLFPGLPLFRWAEGGNPGRAEVRQVLGNLLSDCFRLDAVGLDHGELSHAPRNVLVNATGRPCIVDFESASMVRRVANVTSILQYFLFGRISKNLHSSRLFGKKEPIVKALSEYKQESTVESFQSVLRILRF
jgi:putative serine/threonine protein kinase